MASMLLKRIWSASSALPDRKPTRSNANVRRAGLLSEKKGVSMAKPVALFEMATFTSDSLPNRWTVILNA